MKSCQKFRNLFVEALYNELDASRQKEFRNHLDACPKCQEAWQKLSDTSRILSQKEMTSPDAETWKTFWNRLEPGLSTPRTKQQISFVQRLRFPSLHILRWAPALGILLVGIFIGRFLWMPESPINPQMTSQSIMQNTGLDAQSMRYLERSKILLLSFNNFEASDDVEVLNLPVQKSISNQLIQEAAVLEASSSNKMFTRLLEELETVLLQIANLEQSRDLEAVQIQMIQEGVRQQSLLFKINLMEISADDSTRIIPVNHQNEVSI